MATAQEVYDNQQAPEWNAPNTDDICPGCDKETTVSKKCSACGFVIPAWQYTWHTIKNGQCTVCRRKNVIVWTCNECGYIDDKPLPVFFEIIEGPGPYYKCPACKESNLTRAFNRCVDCGARLKWLPQKKTPEFDTLDIDLKRDQLEEDARDMLIESDKGSKHLGER